MPDRVVSGCHSSITIRFRVAHGIRHMTIMTRVCTRSITA
ncbi:MAG TPA: CRISPR-associated DxTHG motif protein [Alphaproteobacteria bacterium]|nr:CRISPR-associated DxTHG motif protein [Alphaproteobacteria bacterium]